MALKGDLASVDLAQVFQMLALNQKVGMLSIQGADAWKALYFDHRGVTLFYNEHLVLDRVLGNMVRSGRLHEQGVRDSRDHAAKTGHSVVDVMLAGGFFSEEELEDSFRTEMEEEVYDLFFWRDARFEFFEGATGFDGREGVVNERFFFSTDSLIMEAARRIDEWTFIKERVPSAEEIFLTTEDQGRVMELEDVVLSVYELVDGKRNVNRLVEVTGLSAFHVYKSLANLLEQQMVQPMLPGELIAAAQECVAEGRLKDAINLYERAVTLEEGIPDTHSLVAEAYEATQEYELAAYHLKCVAEHHAGLGEIPRAVELLQHVIGMMPTDLGARERLVELTVGGVDVGADVDPVAEGKILVDLYVEIGEIDRVRGILEKLLRDNPEDIELKKSLINVHTKAGDTKRVIELYESIAKDLVDKGDPIEAVKYLQKILMIDRSRKDISERIRSLYEMDERRRSRRRTMAALAAMLCLIAALGAVWYFYEQHARERFDALEVSQLIEAKEFQAASAVFSGFMESYPLTLVARDAEAEIARIESMRLAHEAQLKQQQIRLEAEHNRRRTKYREEWDRYLKEFRSQNLAAALEHIENVRRMVDDVGGDIDTKWAEKVQLDRSVNELRKFLGEAAALERTARELLADDEWRRARDNLLVLTGKYELTEVAQRARIPVMLKTVPAGAAITRNGEPILRLIDGEERPLVTPAVVFCHPKRSETFELSRRGFRSANVTVSARASAESVHVLTVIPDAVVTFQGAVQSGVGAAGGYLAAGTRGGGVGVVRTNGDPIASVDLGGLREIVGTPMVTMDHVLVRTNEDELASYRLRDGGERFSIPFEQPPAHDLVAKDGRVLFVDTRGTLRCLDTSHGRELWSKPIPGEFAGRPTLARRRVRLGTRNGEFLLLDVSDGNVVRHFTKLPGVQSPILAGDGFSFFATVEGRVVAMDESTGRVAWHTEVGSLASGSELSRREDSLFVLNQDAVLHQLSVTTGELLGSFELPGRPVSGPVLAGQKLFVVVREELPRQEASDLLLALQTEDLSVAWEFRDGGIFRGPVTTDGAGVYLPDSQGKALRFR